MYNKKSDGEKSKGKDPLEFDEKEEIGEELLENDVNR